MICIAGKQIDLAGYGRITIVPVNIKEKEYETVDRNGALLQKKAESGVSGKSWYETPEGAKIPTGQIWKKFVIDDEEIIAPKLDATKAVDAEDIELIDDISEIYNAIERKIYIVFTDSKKLDDTIFGQGKSLRFPFVAGKGWKIYNGILTRWQDKMAFFPCRGNLNEVIGAYRDEVVELEIDAPQKETAKKLLKAVAAC